MFSKFKISVIYLIIQLICANVTPSTGEKPTLSFEEQVKKELDPLKDRFKKIIDSIPSVDLKIEVGVIQGQVEKIIERAVKADQRIDQLNEDLKENIGSLKENIGSLKEKMVILKEKMNDADKYKLALGLTYRIDTLESILAPGVDFNGKQRRQRWLTILNLTTPAVEKFRKKIVDAGMTILAFAGCIETLCNERNNRAGYAKISLPRILNEKTIEGALAIMEIIDDISIVETVKIIVSPVEDVNLTTIRKP